MFESQNGSINCSNTAIFATGATCVSDQESCQVVYSAMASTESFQRFSRTYTKFSLWKYAGGKNLIFLLFMISEDLIIPRKKQMRITKYLLIL